MPVDQRPVEPGWEAWSRGGGRCPFCVDVSWGDFVAMCDCWEVDREIERRAELRFLEVEALEDLMSEPAGGHNYGRSNVGGRWRPLETADDYTEEHGVAFFSDEYRRPELGAASHKRFVDHQRKHGTRYVAQKLGCKCDECRAWKRKEWQSRHPLATPQDRESAS